MVFGFAGAHRSGKTTLAKDVSDALGIHFHQTNTAEMLARHGIDPVGKHGLVDRLEIQRLILKNHLAELARLPRPVIVDRTPADMFAYMAAEVTMHNTAQEFGEYVDAYRLDCIDAIRTHYDTITVCRPLTYFERNLAKPPENLAYQWQIQYLIEGILNHGEMSHLARFYLRTNDRKERAGLMNTQIASRINELAQERKTVSVH